MSASVMQAVERKMEIQDRLDRMPQTTEDFFTRDDRKELIKQGLQGEQILRELGEIKRTAKEDVQRNGEYVDAHEKRIRALEDDRLELRTQIRTSRAWIILLSVVGSGIVNFLIKLIWK